jgi:hypothetical protein
MICQKTLDRSVATVVVALAVVAAVMTKETPATMVPTVNMPRGAAPVAPILILERIMRDDAVTEVVAIVAVPATRVTDPNEFAPAAVVVATLVLLSLLPAVPRTKFPFVAVIFPAVAVTVVVAAIDPGATTATGSEKVRLFNPPVVVICDAVPAIVTWPVPSGTTGLVPASGIKDSIG